MGPIELRQFGPATPAAREEVARVMGECADYYEVTEGRAAGDHDVDQFFVKKVPGIDPANDRAYGIFDRGEIVGLAHIGMGWKRPGQSMIGLLMVGPRHRRKGYARAAYEALAAIARASPHGKSLRIGVVETNTSAFAFWRRLGFRENGERYTLEEYRADVVILEQVLADGP